MRRRELIVGAGVALSAFAGCLGEEQVALSERPPENEVEDAIRIAVGEANTVALELATAREDAGSPADVSVDAAALQERLDGARSGLDGVAGSEAAGDYQAELEAARSYVGVVEGLVQGTASLADAAGRLAGLESELQNGNYDAAAQEIDAIQPTVDDARTAAEDAQADANAIDAETLDPYGAKMGELEDGLEAVGNLSVGADELTTGYESVLTGQDHMETGGAAYQAGDVATAEAEFQAAGEEFDAATGHFETARSETDGELEQQISVALCRSRALSEAADHYEASAVAAGAGDLATAQNERTAGDEDVQTAGRCG